jgi:hypothetical protein
MLFLQFCRVPFRKGQSGNPAGRKPGSLGKKTLALAENPIEVTAEENGGKIGKALSSSIALRTEVNLALRISAASALLPYEETRKSARYIDQPFELPVPTSVEAATENIAKLASAAAAKTLALDEMNDLIGAQKAYIEAKVGLDIEGQMLELRQIVEKLSASSRAVEATIIGGLPPLPGTNISMLTQPLNGNAPPEGE